MYKKHGKEKLLALMILAYILSNNSSVFAQGPIQSTTMVSPSNNSSSNAEPYNSILVTQDSANSSILIGTDKTIYIGVGNNGNGTQPLNVYLTNPVSGNYTVIVSNDGSKDSGRVMAGGVGSLSSAALTNIHGPLSVQVTATGAGTGKAIAEAIGIGAISGTLNTESANVKVTATGGITSVAANAIAHGVVNGSNDGMAGQPVMNIGNSTGENTLTVLAAGGRAQGILTDVSVVAYGAENYNNLTFRGTTTISAVAQGGSLAAGGSYTAGAAYGEAYGLYNSGTGSVIVADSMIIDQVKGLGSVGSDARGVAAGIYNDGGSVTMGTLAMNNILAESGTASGQGVAGSTAFGVQNALGTVTTGTFDVTVTAKGGTSDTTANAQAFGLAAGEEAGIAANLVMGTTGSTNTVTVTATGGKSSGLNTNNDVTATAYGVYGSNETTLKGKTTFSVQATGGRPFEAGNTAGNANATAYGLYNQGIKLITDDLTFITVTAKGDIGFNTYAEAYGMYNDYSAGTSTSTTGTLTFTDVSAMGGSASTDGNANATAYLLKNNQVTMTVLGKITGTATATGGTGPYANTGAYGIENGATLIADNFDFTVIANSLMADYETTADARGITNYGTLTMNNGANKVNVTAQGGLGNKNGALVNAVAYGIQNTGTLTLVGPTTIQVQATGGVLAATAPASSTAFDASAEAYGLWNAQDEITAGALTMNLVKAKGGTAKNAYAIAMGISNENAPDTITATSIVMQEVRAEGGTGTGDNYAQAYAQAYGIKNKYSTFKTTDATAANSLLVRAVGGMGTSANNNVTTEAYGIAAEDSGKIELQGNWHIDVQATGGGAIQGVIPVNRNVEAVGILNQSADGVNVAGPVTIYAAAMANSTAGNKAEIYAGGIYSADGMVQLQGNADITTYVRPDSGGKFIAASLYAMDDGIINVGTDGTTSLGKVIKLSGDVIANSTNAVINVALDQTDSYLQGNVKGNNGGVVNLVVGNGAVWKPVYDNRNGSFFNPEDSATFTKDYTVADNSITRLTLNDGGIVDLTWDNSMRNPFTSARTLSIHRLTGNNGTFMINSDLAHNVADKISVAGADVDTVNEYIQVKYDPYLTTTNLGTGEELLGKAEVVSSAPNTLSFTGKQGEYNTYKYTPTVVKDTDGKWYLTSIKIGEDSGGGSEVTGPVRTVAQTHLGLQNLFLGETNNLEQRLGDLRQGKEGDAGVWARYHHGKLEHNESNIKYNLFQAGFDKESNGPTEKTYRGLALSHAKGSGTYEIGNGDLSETTLSLYQTGIKKNGQYYDLIFKAGRYSNDYDLLSKGDNKASADYHTWAYSISGEYGVRKQLGYGYYVEPQAELILGRIQGADYVTSTNMKAKVDAQNKAIARIGVAAGKEFNGGNIYGKVSYYHDFSGGIHIKAEDTTNSAVYSEDVAHNWVELSLGGNAKAGKNMVIYGELSKYLGQLKSNLQVNVGARWTF